MHALCILSEPARLRAFDENATAMQRQLDAIRPDWATSTPGPKGVSSRWPIRMSGAQSAGSRSHHLTDGRSGYRAAIGALSLVVGPALMRAGDLMRPLLQTFQSLKVFMALVPGLLALFAGVALFVAPLASHAGPFRWPALLFALGAALILGEIILAEVLLSQIGNVIILIAGTAFARWLLRDDARSTKVRPETLFRN